MQKIIFSTCKVGFRKVFDFEKFDFELVRSATGLLFSFDRSAFRFGKVDAFEVCKSKRFSVLTQNFWVFRFWSRKIYNVGTWFEFGYLLNVPLSSSAEFVGWMWIQSDFIVIAVYRTALIGSNHSLWFTGSPCWRIENCNSQSVHCGALDESENGFL